MAQTTALIQVHLPTDLAKMVISFFSSFNEINCVESGLWEYCLEIKNVRCGLRRACKCGYVDIAKLMIEKGATNIEEVFDFAVSGNQIEIIKYFSEIGNRISMSCVYSINFKTSVDIIKILAQHIDNKNVMLRFATMQGNYEVAKYLIEMGANNFNESLYYACFNRRYVRIYKNDSNSPPRATTKIFRNIIELLITSGATECDCKRSIRSHLAKRNKKKRQTKI